MTKSLSPKKSPIKSKGKKITEFSLEEEMKIFKGKEIKPTDENLKQYTLYDNFSDYIMLLKKISDDKIQIRVMNANMKKVFGGYYTFNDLIEGHKMFGAYADLDEWLAHLETTSKSGDKKDLTYDKLGKDKSGKQLGIAIKMRIDLNGRKKYLEI